MKNCSYLRVIFSLKSKKKSSVIVLQLNNQCMHS